jgi:hypothetical protein
MLQGPILACSPSPAVVTSAAIAAEGAQQAIELRECRAVGLDAGYPAYEKCADAVGVKHGLDGGR